MLGGVCELLGRGGLEGGPAGVDPVLNAGVSLVAVLQRLDDAFHAAAWNGPVQRPRWWWKWQQAKSNLTTYTFSHRNGTPAAVLSLTTKRHQRHGTTLQVHDFWASNTPAVAAMFAFLGRYSTRAETIDFRRGTMPPYPSLLHTLHRHRVTAEAWHPWMIRILDLPGAVRARGWPTNVTADIVVEVLPDNVEVPPTARTAAGSARNASPCACPTATARSSPPPTPPR